MNRGDKRLFGVTAAEEAVTGLALILAPRIMAGLLFAAEPSLEKTAMSRVAGISLLALGWVGWPGIDASRSITTLLNCSLLVTVYLGYVGFVGKLVGPLLWPAFALHGELTGLLGRALAELRSRKHVLPASASSDSRQSVQS